MNIVHNSQDVKSTTYFSTQFFLCLYVIFMYNGNERIVIFLENVVFAHELVPEQSNTKIYEDGTLLLL